MTAKHRKSKSNKSEENNFKHEIPELDVRPGNQYALLFVLFLIIVIGGSTVGWFCFQQHQTLTYLTDNLMGMQMRMVKLQGFQEELRKSTEKHGIEGIEQRLHSLEESYSVAQKQVGMALATAEQLKTSDLPAQVLSLHTEMKARLAEMQAATVSADQLSQLEATIAGQSTDVLALKEQVQGLAGASAELSQTVESLSGSLESSQAQMDDRSASLGALGAQLEDQAAKVQGLNDLVAAQQAQLEASTQDIAGVKALLEAEGVQREQQANVEEQLESMRSGLQEQSKAAQSLHSELKTQLDTIQAQVAQLESAASAPVVEEEAPAAEEAAPEAAEEDVAPEVVEEEEAPVEEEEVVEEEEAAPIAATEEEEVVEEASEPEAVEEEEPAAAEE